MTGRKDLTDNDQFIVDDVDEDAAAAYREVMEASAGKIEAETPPVAAEQTEAETPPLDASATERDETGRFRSKETVSPAVTDDSAAPPPSWSVKAKTAWANVPTEVRAEITKREGEVANGLRSLADYKDLKPYADAARQQNTTIKGALDHYHGIDRLMQQDLAGGLAIAAESYGHTKEKLGQIFAGLAQKYGANVSPSQNNAQPNGAPNSEDEALMQILAPLLNPLKAQIDQLSQATTSRVEADRNAQVQTLAQEINRFSADPKNIYFTNVEADIARLFERGMVPLSGNPAKDLQAAYDIAVRLNPDVNEALIEKRLAEKTGANRQKEQEAANKAKNASRSLGGSKIPGTIYKEKESEDFEPDDIEADVRKAYRAHMSA